MRFKYDPSLERNATPPPPPVSINEPSIIAVAPHLTHSITSTHPNPLNGRISIAVSHTRPRFEEEGVRPAFMRFELDPMNGINVGWSNDERELRISEQVSVCYHHNVMAVLTDTFSEIITINDAGVWRVAGTRVSVDSVVYAFNEGASPEEIVWRFDTLDLKKVYALINYYLHNREKVDKYLAQSEKAERKILRRLDKEFPSADLREKLLARRRNLK